MKLPSVVVCVCFRTPDADELTISNLMKTDKLTNSQLDREFASSWCHHWHFRNHQVIETSSLLSHEYGSACTCEFSFQLFTAPFLLQPTRGRPATSTRPDLGLAQPWRRPAQQSRSDSASLECSHCRKLFKKSKDHRVQAWKGFCALTLQRLRRKLYPSPAILCAELALDCTSCPSAILDSKIALLNLRIS